VLRRYLLEYLMRTPWREGYIFGAASTRPFWIDTPQKRAARQWAAWNKACDDDESQDRTGEKVTPIGLHEARHTFASLMIASMSDAGKFNAKVLQELMGHASITETFDRYGHLFPGTKDEAAQLLDAYLERKAASDA
jgi:integrase